MSAMLEAQKVGVAKESFTRFRWLFDAKAHMPPITQYINNVEDN